MKPVNVSSCLYIDFNKKNYKEDPKFKCDDHARLLKYKTFLSKVLFQIGLMKFLLLKKLKIPCRWHMLSVILTEKKSLERFTKKNYKKQMERSLELKK